MGADSTLVNAAFKESESKYAGNAIDMKPLYDSNAAINTKATNLILGAIDIYSKEQKVKKDGMKAQLDIFNQNAEDANVKYYKNGEPMDQLVINAVQDKIKGLQAEFELVNTFGKNDNAENERARAKLNASLKQIVATLNYNRTGLMKLNDSKGDINTGTVKTENLIAFNKVLSGEYDELGFDKSNNLLYTIYDTDDKGQRVSKSYTFQQLEKGLPMLDRVVEKSDIAQQNANTTLALNNGATSNKGDNPDYNHKIATNNYMQMITDKTSFATLANNINVDGNPTFKQSLEISGVVLNDLISLLLPNEINELDMLDNKDDGEFQKDFTNVTSEEAVAANLKEFIDILTNENHPHFDLDRSKKLLANYKADLGKMAYDYHWQNEYDKKYPKPVGITDYQRSQAHRIKEINEFLTPRRENYKNLKENDTIGSFGGGRSVVLKRDTNTDKLFWQAYAGQNPIAQKFPHDPSVMGWAVEDFLIRN